jgi:hypothetical protein
MIGSLIEKGVLMNTDRTYPRRLSIALMAFTLVGGVACTSDTPQSATPAPTPQTSSPASSPSPTASANLLPQGSEPYDLTAADFVTTIDHPYWPMTPGNKWIYREAEGGSVMRVVVTVTNKKKDILGIQATVVHDTVSEDGKLVEDTFDWYGQDQAGNLWYLGEDTKEYEDGKVVSTEGSWEAGVDGALAGVILPADPQPGMTYRQEYLKGEAEDLGEILSIDELAQVPFGKFDNVVMTKDYTPLEPNLLEHKFYAPGVGQVLALTISGGAGREELLKFIKG